MPDDRPDCRVALYCRVGRDDTDAPGVSMEQQRQTLLAYARDMGYMNTAAYMDDGFNSLDTGCPAFAALNADIAAGNVKTVLMTDPGRVCRDGRGREWFDRMDKLGVTVLCKEAPAYQEENAEPFFQYKRKKRRQERHTVRTPPPKSKTR